MCYNYITVLKNIKQVLLIRGENMEKRIAEAVLEEIKIHGFKFTMDDITARLHMSKSSLYKLVGSKDKLVHNVISFIKEDFEAQKRQLLAEETDRYSKICRFIELYVEIFRPYNNNIYKEIKLLYYAEWERWQQFQQENVDCLLQLLQDGINAGEFRQVNIRVVRQIVLTAAIAMTDYQFLQENNLTYYDALETLSDLIFNGLKK